MQARVESLFFRKALMDLHHCGTAVPLDMKHQEFHEKLHVAWPHGARSSTNNTSPTTWRDSTQGSKPHDGMHVNILFLLPLLTQGGSGACRLCLGFCVGLTAMLARGHCQVSFAAHYTCKCIGGELVTCSGQESARILCTLHAHMVTDVTKC